jgi:hypothetical protein
MTTTQKKNTQAIETPWFSPFTYRLVDPFLVRFFMGFPFDTTAMLHAKPGLAINVGMDILFIVTKFDVVPFRVVKRFAHDG